MYQYSIVHPTTIVLAGPTKCGKTQFLLKVLREQRIRPEPQRIVWIYGEWQPAYEELQRDLPEIHFIKDFDPTLYDTFDLKVRNLVIINDQMENKAVHKRGGNAVTKYFTQGSHHRNLTVVYIVQNLFNNDAAMRTVSLNTHYMVLFKNPRDATQIRTLGYQMYPESTQFLTRAYSDATSKPYGYIIIDLRPEATDALRVCTDIFADNGATAYVPGKKYERIRNSRAQSSTLTQK